MIVELGVRVPLTNIEAGVMTYDPSGPSRDHAAAASAEGADLVRDAGKPSASLYRESPLDELLSRPSSLDKLLGDDGRG
jgi:hypothetical protein